VQTTESYRSLKHRAAKQAHELEAWRDKARTRGCALYALQAAQTSVKP